MIIYNYSNKGIHLQQRYKLKVQVFISRVIAFTLLLVLMLAITPKSFLHHVFADHSDAIQCNDSLREGPCIHKQGFNCQQADLVAPSHFTLHNEVMISKGNDIMSLPVHPFSSSLFENLILSITERGPPAHV